MKTSEFDYELPQELIAQRPLEQRDSSRLMVVNRTSGSVTHRTFRDIAELLEPGDILVVNDSRVIPARLLGVKSTGGQCEILLLEPQSSDLWRALVRGRKLTTGTAITLQRADGTPSDVKATIFKELEGSQRVVHFSTAVNSILSDLGHTPLPPYIKDELSDPERYQTVYGVPEGSAAAPTAGLHFTPELLLDLRERGVGFERVTLHVGLDTFKPVKSDEIHNHVIHSEWVEVTPEVAERINRAKLSGGRIIAVGTTAVRTLESAAWRAAGVSGSLQRVSSLETPPACPWKPVSAIREHTDLFIYPGYTFRAVDAMITNFHLPRSSLLMLVAAFSGHDLMFKAYDAAIAERYRFYSFGDAMFIQ